MKSAASDRIEVISGYNLTILVNYAECLLLHTTQIDDYISLWSRIKPILSHCYESTWGCVSFGSLPMNEFGLYWYKNASSIETISISHNQ